MAANADHEHDHEQESTYGMALGFRILEDAGKMYLAEAEISPYVDEPEELGVTLVFHPLDGLDPADPSEDTEWPAWPIDMDDELTRRGSDPITKQFDSIVRQLQALTDDELSEYLRAARDEAEPS